MDACVIEEQRTGVSGRDTCWSEQELGTFSESNVLGRNRDLEARGNLETHTRSQNKTIN